MLTAKKVVLSALLVASLGAGVIAQEQLSGEAAIEARKELMRSNAAAMGSAAEKTGAEAVAVGETLVGNFERLPDLFPEDSMEGETRALPKIWEEWEEFEGHIADAHEAAEAVLAAAQAGDTAAYATALEGMGAQCGACHSEYRAPQG